MSDHQHPRPARRTRPRRTGPSPLHLVPTRSATPNIGAPPGSPPADAASLLGASATTAVADLMVALSFAFTGGWLPGDLVALLARTRSAIAQGTVLLDLAALAVVHQQAADQEPPPEWVRHLAASHRRLAASGFDLARADAVDIAPGRPAHPDIGLVARALLDEAGTDAGRRAVTVLERWLWHVPLVATLAPPPGHWPPARDGLDAAGLALLGAEEPPLPEVLLLRLLLDRPYVAPRLRLLQGIAVVGGCLTLPEPAIDGVVVVGLTPAVDRVGRLYRLVEQRAFGALATTATVGPARSFRTSFLLGFARTVAEQLTAEARARQVPGPSLFGIGPSVVDGFDPVRDLACIALSTGLTPPRRRATARSGPGWAAGIEAAHAAPVTDLLTRCLPAPFPTSPAPTDRPAAGGAHTASGNDEWG